MRTGAVVIAPGGTVTHTARPSAQGAASMPAAFAVAAAERSVIKPSPALSQRRPSSRCVVRPASSATGMVSVCLRTVSTIGTLSRRVRVSQVVAAVPSASA